MTLLQRMAGSRPKMVFCGVAVMALAACGTTGGTTSSAPTSSVALPAEAATRLDKSLQPITVFPGPDTSIAPAAGKKITVITCAATGETCVRIATGAQEAGKILGWDVTVVDGKGQPAEWNAAMSRALAGGTDGIILAAVPPALVGAGLEAAKNANIPVIYSLGLDAQGATALVTNDRAESGRVMADYVARDSGGTGQVMLLRDPEFPELESMAEAFKTELASACPQCSIKSEQSFTLGAMAQTLPTIVQTALQSNPGINYVFGPYDVTSTFISQGVRAAAHPAVKVLGSGGDATTIESLKSGDINASMGVPAEWSGFQAIDAIARAQDGQQIPSVPLPQGLVVQSNMAQVAPNGTYDGGFDYAAAYRKVWGK